MGRPILVWNVVGPLVGVYKDTIVVYVDAAFVHLVLDGLVPYISYCPILVLSNHLFQTFFISDSNVKQDSWTKPAQACDGCYDTVFPVIHPPPSEAYEHEQ